MRKDTTDKLYGGSFISAWRRSLDAKAKRQQLSKPEKALRGMITELFSMREHLKVTDDMLVTAKEQNADLRKRLAEAEKQIARLREALESSQKLHDSIAKSLEIPQDFSPAIGRAVSEVESGKITQALEHKGDGSGCEWEINTDPDGDVWYMTNCGQSWTFTEGDIEDNEIKFCPYCGKPISLPAEKGENNKTKSP